MKWKMKWVLGSLLCVTLCIFFSVAPAKGAGKIYYEDGIWWYTVEDSDEEEYEDPFPRGDQVMLSPKRMNLEFTTGIDEITEAVNQLEDPAGEMIQLISALRALESLIHFDSVFPSSLAVEDAIQFVKERGFTYQESQASENPFVCELKFSDYVSLWLYGDEESLAGKESMMEKVTLVLSYISESDGETSHIVLSYAYLDS